MGRLSEGFREDRSQPPVPSYGWTSSELESAANESGDVSSIQAVYRGPQPAAAFRPMARRTVS